jgi:DNA polymerase III delta prime subunit
MTYEEEALAKLVEISDGDLRRSINMMHSASILHDKNITEADIFAVGGVSLFAVFCCC